MLGPHARRLGQQPDAAEDAQNQVFSAPVLGSSHCACAQNRQARVKPHGISEGVLDIVYSPRCAVQASVLILSRGCSGDLIYVKGRKNSAP